MGLIRSLITLALLAGIVVCSTTVKVGKRTTWGHLKNIWAADETQELVEGVKEKSEPVVDRVKREVKEGLADDESGDASAKPVESPAGK
jgi:hypothetical protein